jgi:hypothetical protein
MSISSLQPPGPPVEDWDALAAPEASRQRDVEACRVQQGRLAGRLEGRLR